MLLWPGEEWDEIPEPGRTINGWVAKLDPAQERRVVWFVDGHVEQMDEASFRAMVPEGVDVDALDGP